MITIDSLRVRLGGRTVLDGVTMHLPQNAVHGLVGINGAGKTTLMNTLYGFVAPSGGSITLDGHPLRRRDIAYLESVNSFYPGMTGRDYLDLVAHYHPSFDPAPCIRRFRLPLDTPIENCSEGTRRKLALTAVLMQRKRLVLLDEPFNGLDIESLYVAQQLILALGSEGRTVLVSSHVLATIEPLCDDLYLMDGGCIRRRYDRTEFRRAEREIEEIFRRHYALGNPEN